MKPCCIATSQPLKEEIQQLKEALSIRIQLLNKAEAKIEAAKTKEQKYREWLEKNTFSRNIDSDDSISPSNVYIETTNDALSKFKEVFSEGFSEEKSSLGETTKGGM